MEAALLSGLIKVIVPQLSSAVVDNYQLSKGLKRDMDSLGKELSMIYGAIDDELSSQSQIGHCGAVQRLAMEELRELAYDIEDCIDKILYRATRKDQSSVLGRTLRSPKTVYTQLQLAQEMQRLKKQAVEISQRKQRYTVVNAPHASAQDPAEEESSDPSIIGKDLVGVEAPRAELRAQLLAEAGERQLKVISIIGFSGCGKTALAAEAYNQGKSMFDRVAWVCAAHKEPNEVLADMFRRLRSDSTQPSMVVDKSDSFQLRLHIKQLLKKKRYLIVIDDIRTKEQWDGIRGAFPDDQDVSSRIVVTTTTQPVGNICSSSESYQGYVLKINRLDEIYSRHLFYKKACPKKYLHYRQPNSDAILKKCDGQPLALVTVGEFLRTNGWPTGPFCQDICNRLQYHLRNGSFERMERIMIRNYTSLPGHALRACLLYFSMFPCDNPVGRKRLLRRWLAEGFSVYSSDTVDPTDAFKQLMDREIIRPINVSNNCNVKTCKTYGMMHEFLLRKANSENFVTLLCDEKLKQPRYVRRLSVHGNTAIDAHSLESIDLSLVRSLVIFGKAGQSVLDFSKYQLLRVLDLENCYDLKDDHVENICNLLLLKYMSLGGEVSRLPSNIGNLKYLEALDLRKTKVNVVPVEVFLLPYLIHLFGKFKLPDKVKNKTKVLEFLSGGNSKLETLAGFVTDGREGFLHLMGSMKKLRKVKIWCKSCAGSTDRTDVRKAIQKFITLDEKDAGTGRRALSLHLDEWSDDFLTLLEGSFYLSSLKLHGIFPTLPQFVASVRGLLELSISSTSLKAPLLEALGTLSYLQYLKLIADDIEKFIIKDKAFPHLLRLSIVLKYPTFPSFEQGSLPHLVTLQMLCKDLDGLSDIKIERLIHLQEVTLDTMVTLETKKQWKKAANEHPNRPKIMLLNSNDAEECELADYLR